MITYSYMFQCIVHLNKIQKNQLLFHRVMKRGGQNRQMEHSIVKNLASKRTNDKNKKTFLPAEGYG